MKKVAAKKKKEDAKIQSMGCIVCKRPLADACVVTDGNQPHGATEMIGGGCYGSRITDDATGVRFAVNVCDDCLLEALGLDLCRVFKTELPPRPIRRYVSYYLGHR